MRRICWPNSNLVWELNKVAKDPKIPGKHSRRELQVVTLGTEPPPEDKMSKAWGFSLLTPDKPVGANADLPAGADTDIPAGVNADSPMGPVLPLRPLSPLDAITDSDSEPGWRVVESSTTFIRRVKGWGGSSTKGRKGKHRRNEWR